MLVVIIHCACDWFCCFLLFVVAAQLYAELSQLNLNLPARVCLPLFNNTHQVLRIPSSESVVLNSKNKVWLVLSYIIGLIPLVQHFFFLNLRRVSGGTLLLLKHLLCPLSTYPFFQTYILLPASFSITPIRVICRVVATLSIIESIIILLQFNKAVLSSFNRIT